jgi:hypothetical protein
VPRPLQFLPFLALATAVFVLFFNPEREVGATFSMDAEIPKDPIPPLSFPHRAGILEGRVQSADGAPVADALVFVDAGDRPAWCRSGPDGAYRLTNLTPPPWEITLVAPGHVNARITVASHAEGAILHPGEPLPEPATIPEAAISPLRGRVLAAAPEDDLSGYEIALMPTATADTFGAPFPLRHTLGPDGSFEIPAARAGTYHLLVLPPWARGGGWPDLTRPLDAEPGLFEHPVGGEQELLLPLVAGEVRGRILGAGQGHLAGALVTVRWEADGAAARHWPPVATEEDGTFRIRDLPPGSYRVTLRAGEGGEEQIVEVRERSILKVDFDPVGAR